MSLGIVPHKAAFNRVFSERVQETSRRCERKDQESYLGRNCESLLGDQAERNVRRLSWVESRDYRIIYLVDEASKQVVFIDVGPRRAVY